MTLSELLELVQSYVALAWSRRLLVGGCAFLFAGLGVLRLQLRTPQYEAQVKILPYRSAPAGGGLSGLAGLAGIRLPVNGGEQTITVELYPDVAKTLAFKAAVAESELTFPSRGARMTLREFLEDTAAVRRAREREAKGPHPVRDSFPEGVAPYTPEHLSILSGVASRIEVLFDRRTSIVTVKARLPDDVAAAELAHVATQRLMESVRAVDIRKAEEQLRFVEQAYVASAQRYSAAQLALAAYADRNRVQNSAVSSVERSRLEREAELAFEVYQQLSRELEQAKTKVSQDTPVYSVLEPATVPARPVGAGLIKTVVVAGVLGGLLGLAVVFWRDVIRGGATADGVKDMRDARAASGA